MARVEPPIRYARTTDGARIAYWTQGDGPPLVLLDVPCFTHVELELRIPEYRAWHTRLAETTRLIRLDLRGGGLSQRDIESVTVESFERDVEAVMVALGIERTAVFASNAAAPVALHLAGRRPELVTHLFIYDGWADGAGLPVHARFRELDQLIDIDWPMYTEMVAKVMMEREGAEARAVSAFLRRCTTPGDWRRVAVAARTFDVTGALPSIVCPTVIMHSGRNRLSPLDASRDLAAAVAGAEFRAFSHVPLPAGGRDEVAEVVEAALGVEPLPRTGGPGPGLRTIVFTDLEGHTAIVDQLGDMEGRTLLREHERLTRRALREHGGSEIKTLGDGFMASFASTQRALECAIALQESVSSSPILSAHQLRVRVGINAGEPIAEEGDLFGRSVIVASRIAGAAAGGGILVANVVRELTAGKGFAFREVGWRELRGLGDPVRLWALEWERAPGAKVTEG